MHDLKPESALFVSWVKFHGRSEGIADALGIPSLFIHDRSGNILIRYFRQWRETRRQLIVRKNLVRAIVMLPPFPALLCCAFNSTFQIAADMHTGVFSDPKWKWALQLTCLMLRRRGIGIVTNSTLADELRRRGVFAIVLDDLITEGYSDDREPFTTPALVELDNTEWVLVPLAYAHDEPLKEVLAAAKSSPDITWVLTGEPTNNIRNNASKNIVFPGYIAEDDYRRAVARAPVVLALTTEENTMQRAGYEAISAGRPLVTSPTKVLTEYFGSAVEYAGSSPSEITQAVRNVLLNRDEYTRRITAQRQLRVSTQDLALKELQSWLHTGLRETEA